MKRIALMVIRLIWFVPYWFIKLCVMAKSEKYTEEERFAYAKKLTVAANRAGRIKIEAHGLENLPEKSGYVLFPNHQGLYDVLAFLESDPAPFTVVMKKEVENVILLKQVRQLLRAQSIDRSDLKASLKVINQMTKEVKGGRNYLIFAEGTRSKNPNHILPFKGGSFKSAVNARCPIVPVALMDSYKAFDTNSIKPLTVKLFYLPPLYYEEYKGMKTVEIAQLVHDRIWAKIQEEEAIK